MTVNRFQLIVAWLGALALIALFALRTASTDGAENGERGPATSDTLFQKTETQADSAAVKTILAILAPAEPSTDLADQSAGEGDGNERAFSNLPDGDFSRPSVAAIVEERGVFTVYLRDADGVVVLGAGETWHEWRITEIRPDRVYFESEDQPFQFRVFAGIEDPS